MPRTWVTLALAFAAAPMLAVGCTALFPFELDETAAGGGGASAGGSGATGGSGGMAMGGGGEAPAGCTSHESCPTYESDGECQTTTCVEGTCMIVVKAAGSPAGTEVVGDCKRSECDDAGAVVEVNDDLDVPVDGNECTQDVCTAGAASNPPEANGTMCGMGGMLVCNSSGACVGCNDDNDCLADEDCLDRFCDTGTTQCSVNIASNGAPCTDDGAFCNGVETCQSAVCTSPGDPCPGPDNDGDCSEECNESSDACTGNDPDGSNCNNGVFCDGPDTCSGGSCDGSGDPCSGPDGDSDCSETCNEANDNCNGNDDDGETCNDGLFCNGTDTCLSGNCATHAGDPCETQPGCGPPSCSEGCNETADSCTETLPQGATCSCIGVCLSPTNCYIDIVF